MTVPVFIDGRGPFDFVLDTGADRSVISRELALTLNLPPGEPAIVHGTGGDLVTPTVRVRELQVGARRILTFQAPLLARADLGALGILGIDSLQDQRLVLDFRAGQLSVEPSRPQTYEPGVIVVHARRRYGQLIMVDADARGVPLYVILDTGAQNTIGNPTLRAMLQARNPRGSPAISVRVLSVTGQTTPGEMASAPDIRIGGFTLHGLTLAFAGLNTFARFELAQRPAMLLGMDVLHKFDRVVVDFGRREVRFQLPRQP